MQPSFKNGFLGGLAFWVFYLGTGLIATVLVGLALNAIAPGAYLVGFLPFIAVAEALGPVVICAITGASAIAFAFTHTSKTPRFVYIVIGVGFILTGIYFLTWMR